MIERNGFGTNGVLPEFPQEEIDQRIEHLTKSIDRVSNDLYYLKAQRETMRVFFSMGLAGAAMIEFLLWLFSKHWLF